MSDDQIKSIMAPKHPRLSFCTTCRDRLWQLRSTLAGNLASLSDTDELCLVDFGSTDGLASFIWGAFKDDINAGRLVFFECEDAEAWHAAKAKNLAHRIAKGDYLFSLDADNFISRDETELIRLAASSGVATHQFSGDWSDGSCGRIGMMKSTFHELGGYDESLLPLGFEDLDLINRVQKVGVPIAKLPPPINSAIKNSNQERGSALSDSNPAGDIWTTSEKANRAIAKLRLELLGPKRTGGFATFSGVLNGQRCSIDGRGRWHEGE